MKIFRYIAALLATTALTVLPTNAQFAAGELVGVSDFQSTDILATARNANSYTTARVAGMAGAPWLLPKQVKCVFTILFLPFCFDSMHPVSCLPFGVPCGCLPLSSQV